MSNFLKKSMAALEVGDLNAALQYVHDAVENVVCQPVMVDKIVGSQHLDHVCELIGKECLTRNLSILDVPSNFSGPPVIIFLLTKWQKTGGHSKIVLDSINANPNERYIFITTGLAGASDINVFKSLLLNKENISIVQVPKLNLSEKLEWLIKYLSRIKIKHAHIFNHHQDSVLISAVSAGLSFEKTFWHHGDHHMTLGIYMKDARHVDLHPMAYHRCREITDSSNLYCPLFIKDHGYQKSLIAKDTLVTATIANSNKVEQPYDPSYVELIPNMLSKCNSQHLHIGKLSILAIARIRFRMFLLQVPQKKFIYIKFAKDIPKVLFRHSVDLYLSSFPYGAATTMIEVMSCSIPVLLHNHAYSRTLSCFELAPPDSFTWFNQSDLFNHINNLSPGELFMRGQVARKYYIENFSNSEIRSQLIIGKIKSAKIPALSSNFLLSDVRQYSLRLLHSSLRIKFGSMIYLKLRKIRMYFSSFSLL